MEVESKAAVDRQKQLEVDLSTVKTDFDKLRKSHDSTNAELDDLKTELEEKQYEFTKNVSLLYKHLPIAYF